MTEQHAEIKRRPWDDTIRTLLVAFVLAITFRSFAFEPFHIPSGSMKSTLLVGDYLFVSKYSYGYSRYSFPLGLPLFQGRILEFNEPKRGDIIVFREPAHPRVDFIKRLIGLPGDHIQLKQGIVYINDVPLKRQPVDEFADNEDPAHVVSVPRYTETLPEGKVINILKEHRPTVPEGDNTPVYVVPPHHYFMMGDNRDHSYDSRFASGVGYVPEENLVGRAEMIFFSVDATFQWSNPASWFSALRVDRFFKSLN